MGSSKHMPSVEQFVGWWVFSWNNLTVVLFILTSDFLGLFGPGKWSVLSAYFGGKAFVGIIKTEWRHELIDFKSRFVMFVPQFFDWGISYVCIFKKSLEDANEFFFFQECTKQLIPGFLSFYHQFIMIRYDTVCNLLKKHFVKLPRVHQQFICSEICLVNASVYFIKLCFLFWRMQT